MTPGGRRTAFYAAALAAGLCLRLWFILHVASVSGDTFVYGGIAKNWLQHSVYGFVVTQGGPQPTLIRLPGYPLFLALCFALFGVEHYTAVMILQCLFDLVTCMLVATLAGRLLGRRAALAALWLGALCPFTSTYAAAPLTEVLTLTTVAFAFYGLERWRAAGLGINRWLWITGFAMAYSLLLRPEQGLLAAAILPAMVWLSWQDQLQSSKPETSASAGSKWKPRFLSRVTLLPAVLASLCVLLPLVPWTARNWRTFHVFQPLAPRSATDPGESVNAGFNRWFRSWAIDYASTEEVYWSYDNTDLDIHHLPTRAFDSQQQYEETRALLTDYNQTDNASGVLDSRFEALADQRIQAGTLRYYFALPAARLVNMLFRPRTEMMSVSLDWWRYEEHPRQTLETTAMAALNLGYLALGGVGMFLWHRHGYGCHASIAWSMLAFVSLRCALLLTLDNSEPRYTLELFPVLILWASFLFCAKRVPQL